MTKIGDFLKIFFPKNFGKLALITSITTLNSSNKFIVKLIVLLIILTALKIFTSKKISFISKNLLSDINFDQKNKIETDEEGDEDEDEDEENILGESDILDESLDIIDGK